MRAKSATAETRLKTDLNTSPAADNAVLELDLHQLTEASGGAVTAGVAILVIGAAAGAVYGVVKSAYRLGNVLGEMLVENHSLDHFIDPGFAYRNRLLNKIYGGELKQPAMQRVTFSKGGMQGSVLSLGSVMMATANGVDTHPVHRGVWLLENILGMPTPPPPPEVEA